MNDVRIRLALALCLTGILLGLSPLLANASRIRTALKARDWSETRHLLAQPQISLCGSSCRCSYADRIINGQPYTAGQPGYRLCTTSCGASSCNFRPGVDGCGAILYLGCSDLNCRNSTPLVVTPVPIHTGVVIQPTVLPTARPTVPQPTVESICTAPLEWVELQQPRISQVFHVPPYPILQSQVTPRETVPEVIFSVDVRGGMALLKAKEQETVCPNGGSYPDDCPGSGISRCRIRTKATYKDPAVHVQTDLQLANRSRNWITGYLASRYFQADVRRPFSSFVWNGSSMSKLVVFPAWDPQDPGHYTALVTATTSGTPISEPQTVTFTHLVDVSLLDTTLAP